jgi:hypothetical protein
MVSLNGNPSPDDIAERGRCIYLERLRAVLEPSHNGEYVVIDVETGGYEIDTDHLAASDRAFAKWPGGSLYCTRVGYGAAGRIGARGRVGRR